MITKGVRSNSLSLAKEVKTMLILKNSSKRNGYGGGQSYRKNPSNFEKKTTQIL